MMRIAADPHGRAAGRSAKELGDVNAQRVRQRVDVVEGEVALTPFDRADVGAVDLSAIGQHLLRPPTGGPQGADAVAERPATGLEFARPTPCHGGTLRRCSRCGDRR